MASKSSDLTIGGLIIMGLILCFGVGGCCLYSGKGVTYSDGYRDGHIQKFSKKGFVLKTWEGEMAMPGVKLGKDNNVSNVFSFTVDDPTLVKQIEELNADDYVRVHYDQRVIYSPLVSESGYFVTKIERLKRHD